MTDEKAIIVGAGLGGVALAIALAQAGRAVEVFEQAPVLGEIGAGIQVSPNACRVLQAIGALDAVRRHAATPTEYRFRLFDTGETLQTIPLGQSFQDRHGFPYLAVHRADLHMALTERLHDVAPHALRLDAKALGFEEDAQGVSVAFDGGATARGAFLVGADGIKSAIRDQILGPTRASYTGDQAWRVMVDADKVPASSRPNTVDIWVGPGRHAVIYPLRGGQLINFVGLVEDEGWEEESWTAQRPWTDLQKDFAGWHREIQDILEAAQDSACYRWALNMRQPVPNWRSARAVLLGDSAHATLPYMAQGAAMALEDAVVLARALDGGGPIAQRLETYQRARLERTSRVVLESTGNRTLFHLPTASALRAAFAARDINGERNGWLYSYDANSVALPEAD